MSDAHDDRAASMADVTRGLVSLHAEYYGKGPTKAQTYMVNDTVISLLKGGFTTVEKTLIEDGNPEAVHAVRRSFQRAMEAPFRKVVEDATGRTVIGYMSQVHTSPDIAAELFFLEPIATPVVAEHIEDLASET